MQYLLISSTFWSYWVVLAAAFVYAAFMLTSFRLTEVGTWRRAFLAGGPAWIIYGWALLTTGGITVNLFTGYPHSLHPHLFIRMGIESALCLAIVLLLLIPRNLLCRRIQMPTAFTLGVGAAIGCVFADLLFVLWWLVPLK